MTHIRKEALLLEIKEATEILHSENLVVNLLKEKYHFCMEDLIALDFLEDEFTEELVWHLYDKKSKSIYYCEYNPIENSISLSKIEDLDYPKRTFAVLDEYLHLSEDEIKALN